MPLREIIAPKTYSMQFMYKLPQLMYSLIKYPCISYKNYSELLYLHVIEAQNERSYQKATFKAIGYLV